jgi:hypothetical protein
MDIRDLPFNKRLYGTFKPVGEGQKPGQVMFAAMDETWAVIRANNLHTTGINHILYTGNTGVFAGVDIPNENDSTASLQRVDIHFSRYVYYCHTGAYSLMSGVYAEINEQINAKKLAPTGESMEIYGHWNKDESKLVTEILIAVQ